MLAEPAEHEVERVDARRVELAGRLEVEQHDAGALAVGDRAQHLLAHLLRVGPEQRDVEAQHEDAVDRAPLRVPRDAPPRGLLARHLAHHVDVRAARAVDEAEQRLADREEQAVERAEQQDADHRGHRAEEVVAAHPGVAPQRVHVHEAPDRLDDDRGEDGARQVGEQARQRDEHHDDEHGGDQPGDLRAAPGPDRGGGLRQRPGDAETAGQAGGDVGSTGRDQLLVGVDGVAETRREQAAGAEPLGEPDRAQGQPAQQHRRHVGQRDVRQPEGRDAQRAPGRPRPPPGPRVRTTPRRGCRRRGRRGPTGPAAGSAHRRTARRERRRRRPRWSRRRR